MVIKSSRSKDGANVAVADFLLDEIVLPFLAKEAAQCTKSSTRRTSTAIKTKEPR